MRWFIVLIGLAGLLAILPAWRQGAVPSCPAIPSYASANTKVIFCDQFVSLATTDYTNTQNPGFNWYVGNNPMNGYCTSVDQPGMAADPSWYSDSNSILTVSTNYADCQGTENMGFAYVSPSVQHRTIPSIPGSAGFYIEGRMQFNLPNGSPQNFIPDFWIQDFNGMLEQFAGSGSTSFCEIDIFEGNPTQAVQTVDIWTSWNTSSFQRSNADLTAVDYSQYHKWGVLLTTMAQGGGTGSIKWYVDGVLTGTPVTWPSGQFGSNCESADFEINFAAGDGIPLNIDYIMVATP